MIAVCSLEGCNFSDLLTKTDQVQQLLSSDKGNLSDHVNMVWNCPPGSLLDLLSDSASIHPWIQCSRKQYKWQWQVWRTQVNSVNMKKKKTLRYSNACDGTKNSVRKVTSEIQKLLLRLDNLSHRDNGSRKGCGKECY